MNRLINPTTTVLLILSAVLLPDLPAQTTRGLSGPPGFTAAITQLFGEHKAFTANMTIENQNGPSPMVLPGKLSLLNGKARMEVNITDAKGSSLPPQAAAQMQAMGMGQTVLLFSSESSYLIYPGLKAYTPLPDGGQTKTKDQDYKVTRTDLAKETVNGHPCKKQKVVIKEPDGKTHEAIAWAATDLKEFPVMIEFEENGQKGKMKFDNVSFEKPSSELFTPPAAFTKYASVQELMGTVMRRQFGAPNGAPNAAPTAPPNGAPKP